MKVSLQLTAATETVPFDYMYRLIGVFHYWLGQNDIHSNRSLYSLGWLTGGRMNQEGTGLEFRNGAKWEIGVHDPSIMDRLLKGLALKPMVFFGMTVDKVEPIRVPEFKHPKFVFACNSPVLIRKGSEGSERTTLLYDDPDAGLYLSKHLDRKLSEAGLTMYVGSYALYFDPTFKEAKTKLVRIKNATFKANVCPVVCVGPAEVKKFLWTVGAGDLTGSGFGSLTAESHVTRRNVTNGNNRPQHSRYFKQETTPKPIFP